jgi:hypothetical protein
MKYTCRHCDFEYEGNYVEGLITQHERTHPESSIDNMIFDTPDGSKVRCVTCGCSEDHTKPIYGSLGGLSDD